MTAADYPAYCRLEGDAEVRKFTGPPIKIPEAAYLKNISMPSVSCLAVCFKDQGRFIGRCGFREVGTRIELEVFLLPEAQGDRLGGELIDAMIKQCAILFPKSVVAASVSPQNLRAVKLLLRRGFAATGEIVELKSGVPHAVYIKQG